MAVSTGTAIAGTALLGAIRGSQASGGSSETLTRNVASAGANELAASQAERSTFKDLQGLVNAGPGMEAVTGAQGANQSLAAMLQQYSQGGYMPTAQDQQLAQQMLAPQQEAIRQQGIQANQQYAQTAARSGRGPMDFTFQNKLRQQLGDWQMGLSAQQSQLAAQQPGQRLGYAGQLAQLQSGLASQAMSNRQAIMNMGNQIQTREQGFRNQTASVTQSRPDTGGGFWGALTGAMGGFTGGANLAYVAPGLVNANGWSPMSMFQSNNVPGSAPGSSDQYGGGGARPIQGQW